MVLEKSEPGTKITQPHPDLVRVVEGGLSSRIVGIVIFLGGCLILYSTSGKSLMDVTFIFGVLLALFGLVVATQRFRTVLDRQAGMWSSGGDLFFVIPIHSRGPLADLGPVRITRRSVDVTERRSGVSITTYPVVIDGKRDDGAKTELRFGRYWASREEAYEVASALAEFLDRPVQDESAE